MSDTDERDEAHRALNLLASAGFRMGPEWETAHQIAQAHEGKALFDRIHALCHRIEGDSGNAGYWYRRAGEPAFDSDFAAEADAIRMASQR